MWGTRWDCDRIQETVIASSKTLLTRALQATILILAATTLNAAWSWHKA